MDRRTGFHVEHEILEGEGQGLLGGAGTKLAQGEWREARELYERVLALGKSADALEGCAVASWWEDDVDAASEAREQAYALRREAGETLEAARDAGFLASDYGAMRGVNAVASGWLQRARRLVEQLPSSAEHAWLPLGVIGAATFGFRPPARLCGAERLEDGPALTAFCVACRRTQVLSARNACKH